MRSNSKAYYMFLVPKGLNECLVSGAIIFAILAISLSCIKTFVPPKYLLWAILFSFVYALVHVLKTSYTAKNMRYLEESRQIYDKIANNDRTMNINANKIRNDADESQYDLAVFDQRLGQLKDILHNVLEQKENKLEEFDAETAKQIEAKIREAAKRRY